MGFAKIASFTERFAAGSASAICLISADPQDLADVVRAGRAYQRLNFIVEDMGLASCPMCIAIEMAEPKRPNLFNSRQLDLTKKLQAQFWDIFPYREGKKSVMVLRVGAADPPKVRSFRRNVREVLRFQ